MRPGPFILQRCQTPRPRWADPRGAWRRPDDDVPDAPCSAQAKHLAPLGIGQWPRQPSAGGPHLSVRRMRRVAHHEQERVRGVPMRHALSVILLVAGGAAPVTTRSGTRVP
jgi:hypothetical protein